MLIDRIRILGGSMSRLATPPQVPGTEAIGQLAASDGRLLVINSTGIQEIDFAVALHQFQAMEFRPVVWGPVGPTLALMEQQLDYTSQEFFASRAWFNIVDGIQLWTVPITGLYRIRAWSPGRHHGGTRDCRGAQVEVVIRLDAGDVLRLLIGQGYAHMNESCCGATFIESSQLGLICVAGAGADYYSNTGSRPIIDLNNPGDGHGGTGAMYQNGSARAVITGAAGWLSDGKLPDNAGSVTGLVPAGSPSTSSKGVGASWYTTNVTVQVMERGGFGGGGANLYKSSAPTFVINGGGAGYTGGNAVLNGPGNAGTCYAAPLSERVLERSSALLEVDSNGRCFIERL